MPVPFCRPRRPFEHDRAMELAGQVDGSGGFLIGEIAYALQRGKGCVGDGTSGPSSWIALRWSERRTDRVFGQTGGDSAGV